MGSFIGGAGAAFILAAAACVIVKFLFEVNIITDAAYIRKYGKISLITITVGLAYMFIFTLMVNTFRGQTNFFDFKSVYTFLGTSDVLALCESPTAAGLFGGLAMPLFPCLTHVIGGIVFREYALTAMFLSFVSACVFACLFISALSGKFDGDKPLELLLLAFSLPYAFMVFTPSYIAMTLAFIMAGIWAQNKKHTALSLIMLAAACLTSKLGIILVFYYPLFGSDALKKAEKCVNRLLDNAIAFKILLSLLLLFNGAVICCLIRGI